MSEITFVRAESAAESEPLFRSMSHEELVRNCIAAQQMIGTQIGRAEYHKERADRVTQMGKKLEGLCQTQMALFDSIERKLRAAATTFAGRDKRKARAEIYAIVLVSVRETLASPPPKVEWPVEDVHSIISTKKKETE